MQTDKQQAYRLLERLAPGQLAAVVRLLEVMVHPVSEDDEPLTKQDRHAVAASREWFQKNPEGIAFEQVVTDCGLSIDEVKHPEADRT